MRIESLNSNLNIELMLDSGLLKEGNIINGKVIDILDDEVLLYIEGLGLIKGKAEIPIEYLKGSEVKFFVKLNTSVGIKLIPIDYIEQYDKIDNSNDTPKLCLQEDLPNKRQVVRKIIMDYNIKEDETTVKMIENLFKFNIPINKENIERSIRALDKLESIVNRSSEQNVILLNKDGLDPIKCDIMDFILVEGNEFKSEKSFEFIYDEIRTIVSNTKGIDDFIKPIAFLIKNNMNISVNNIKNLFRLLNNEELIPLKLEKEIYNNYDKINLKDKLDDNNTNKRLDITFTKEDIIAFKDYSDNFKKELQIIKSFNTSGKQSTSKETEKLIHESMNSIDFLKEINQEINLFYIPINVMGEERNGSISFMKKSKSGKHSYDRFNIFINLNMEHLNNVKILCYIYDDLIDVNFNLDKKFLSFVKEYESVLYDMVKRKSYRINSLTYTTTEGISILDTFIDNHNPHYYLDIRV